MWIITELRCSSFSRSHSKSSISPHPGIFLCHHQPSACPLSLHPCTFIFSSCPCRSIFSILYPICPFLLLCRYPNLAWPISLIHSFLILTILLTSNENVIIFSSATATSCLKQQHWDPLEEVVSVWFKINSRTVHLQSDPPTSCMSELNAFP